jgi:hypothetical protein
MLTHIANERGYKPNWPATNFKQKFGHYPGPFGATTEPIEPTPEVRRWVKSKQIAYFRARDRAA